MNKSTLITSLLTFAGVLALAIFRLLRDISVYDLSALGRSSILPKTWRRWLYDEHNRTSL
jgi:hypothetical protein